MEDDILFGDCEPVKPVIAGHQAGDQLNMTGFGNMTYYFIEPCAPYRSQLRFTGVDNALLQSTVDFRPTQWRGRSPHGFDGAYPNRRTDGT